MPRRRSNLQLQLDHDNLDLLHLEELSRPVFRLRATTYGHRETQVFRSSPPYLS
jgi:hypothetical protein